MKNLNQLTNNQLLNQTEIVVKDEKQQTIIVLHHLKEIERRRLYCELGFKSMFDYCHLHLKYSRAESYSRIAAMRIMKDLKIVEEKIENGSISLTQAVDLFSSINKNERETGIKLSLAKKESLVKRIEKTSTRESEKILNQELKTDLSLKNERNLKINEKDFSDILQLCKEMEIDNPIDLIKLLVKEKSDEIKTAKFTQKIEKEENVKIESENHSRYIPKQLRRNLLKKANYQCEYVGENGKRCNARTYLQVDHIAPFCLGGRTTRNNLQILCVQHNLFKGLVQLGEKRVRPYLKY